MFLIVLIYYVLANNFLVLSRQVFLGWTSTKQTQRSAPSAVLLCNTWISIYSI